jgi:hypothetical protein
MSKVRPLTCLQAKNAADMCGRMIALYDAAGVDGLGPRAMKAAGYAFLLHAKSMLELKIADYEQQHGGQE